MNVKLTDEQKIKVLNGDDVYSIMQKVLLRENKIDRDKEHFWIVCLAANNRILFLELISLGSVQATIAEPMDVFSFALQKRAVKLILVHNHPSGDVDPSPADIAITDKMQAIGKFINVPVIDHLIISETTFYSFEKTGLLKKIVEESTFDLSFKQIDANIGELKNAEIRGKIEVAKAMLEKGMKISVIAELTGLSKGEIVKLKR